jgi:transcriptional regulator with XRE-family HTH domain
MARNSKYTFEDAWQIGRRIYTIRRSQKLTQKQLAEKCSLSRSAITEIETGRSRPHGVTLSMICLQLGVGLGDIDHTVKRIIPCSASLSTWLL